MVPLSRFHLPSMDVHFLHAFTSTLSLLFYRTAQAFLLYPPWSLLYEHCLVRASDPYIFKRRHLMYYFLNLNLLCSPWTSPSHRTTLECTLPCKTLDIVLRNRLLLRLLWKPPAPVSFEEALQSPPCPLLFEDALRGTLVNHCLKSLRLPLPESSVTVIA